MKTRFGFVSNSSSSNFILAFDKKPQSIEEVRKLFFQDRNKFTSYGYKSTTVFEVNDFSKTILDDLKEAEPMSLRQIIENLCGYCVATKKLYNEHKPYRDRVSEKFRTEYEEKYGQNIYKNTEALEEYRNLFRKEIREEKKEKRKAVIAYYRNVFQNQIKGKKCYCITYSDENGEYYSTLEHGSILDSNPKVPCVVINNH